MVKTNHATYHIYVWLDMTYKCFIILDMEIPNYMCLLCPIQCQANARMQSQLAAMQTEMDQKAKTKQKRKPVTETPTPRHGAPSPASSKPSSSTKVQKAAAAVDPGQESGSDDDEPSQAAKLNRLRRLCERKPSGKLNVPEEIHQQWAAKGHSRDLLLEALEAVNWNTDLGSNLSGWKDQP